MNSQSKHSGRSCLYDGGSNFGGLQSPPSFGQWTLWWTVQCVPCATMHDPRFGSGYGMIICSAELQRRILQQSGIRSCCRRCATIPVCEKWARQGRIPLTSLDEAQPRSTSSTGLVSAFAVPLSRIPSRVQTQSDGTSEQCLREARDSSAHLFSPRLSLTFGTCAGRK